jgi:hypothetical protein
MKSLVLSLMLLVGGVATAAPLIELTPAASPLAGQPGQTVGWGFRVTPDPTYYTSFVGSFLLLESGPMNNTYVDRIGLLGGPVDFALAPGSPAWEEAFSFENQTGVGFYTIDPNALLFAVNTGTLVIQYELYSANPVTCSDCFVSSGEATFEYSAQAVPEPGTWMLAAAGVVATALVRRKAS